VGFLTIPKIGMHDKVIIEGTNTSDLQQGPGHYTGTPLPGEAGNAAIAGHRTTYGAPFYDLDELKPGDPIYVQTIQGSFSYSVTGSQVVNPSDSEVVADTTGNELTLTTCNPRFSASTRLVVHAVLSGNEQPAPPLAPTSSANGQAGGRGGSGSSSGSGSGDLAGSEGDWVPALGLGILAAVVVIAMFVAAHGRRRRVWRWGIYALGGVASLAALFFFFGAISPLLPASF
jgi:sortase A